MRSILDRKGPDLNKKGQGGLSITTLVVIIVAIIVLVFLIYGFTTGFGNLWDRITAFFGGGGGSNVDTHVTACGLACTTNSEFDYCGSKRDVSFGKGNARNGEYNCKALENENVGLDSCDQYVSDETCPVIKTLDVEIPLQLSCNQVRTFVDPLQHVDAITEYRFETGDQATCPPPTGVEPSDKYVDLTDESTAGNLEDYLKEGAGNPPIQKEVYNYILNEDEANNVDNDGKICCLFYQMP